MKAKEILEKYINFFQQRGHKQIENAPLVPENDPTTLFISSGMQPLVPYLLGEQHPAGKRLVNVQNSFRSQDIEEIGDNRHTTFFRMLGNWSLGDYFKKEQLNWFWEFLTIELKLPKEKLYATVFSGFGEIGKDEKSEKIWTKIFTKEGLNPKERIYFYGADKNWWSRSGSPDKMPAGEPGGPDSEVFYDFGEELKIHENSTYKTQPCHPNCDCGRFMEIGNSVFMEFQKQPDGGFKPLPKANVDFGGGLERFLAAKKNEPDIFKTEVYDSMIQIIESLTKLKYESKNKAPMRVIADHLKGSVFIILSGVTPSNKEQGYLLRRLIRRSVIKFHQLGGGLTPVNAFKDIADKVLKIEQDLNEDIDLERDSKVVKEVLEEELSRFGKTLDRGLKLIEKTEKMSGKEAFDLYQSYGFPLEITIELMAQKGQEINVEEFKKEFEKHKNLSRSASVGKFRGGLADASEFAVMGHTATHLLHRALKDVLGEEVNQTGSNITDERVRFDFNYKEKISNEEINRIEQTVNDKIKENLKVEFKLMPLEKAKEEGSIGLFNEKYRENVKVYSIGDYSKEICGGPHVEFTGKLKRFKIIKQESIGQGQKRIYAKVGNII